MKSWEQSMRDGAVSGTVAGLLSMAVLGAASRKENDAAVVPMNAPSHWVWGERAARSSEVNWHQTALGAAIHQGSAIFWGVLYERLVGQRAERAAAPAALLAGLGAAAVACFVDYRVTPARLSPGFEKRLSRPAIGLGYVAFGLGLALTSVARRALRERRANAVTQRPRRLGRTVWHSPDDSMGIRRVRAHSIALH